MKRIILVIFLVLAAVTAGFTGWNVLYLNRTPAPEFYAVRSGKVEEPIRIVLLTDAHQVSFGDRNEKLLTEVRGIKPSMIVMAGDMINMQDPDFDFLKELCQGLASIAPVYYGLGNHENVAVYGTDLDVKDVEKALSDYEDKEDFTPLVKWPEFFADLEEIGVHVLQNQSETVQINGNTIEIGGISTNLSSFWPNSGQFIYRFATENEDRFKILISHRSDPILRYVPDYKIDLVLSGHYHGGTVRIPGIGGLLSKGAGEYPQYDAGMMRTKGSAVIISRGLGNHGLVPRIWNQPEISVIDVR